MSKHKISNSASFPSTISPEVFSISLSLGKNLIVPFLFYNRKDPIVDSSGLFSTEELLEINKYNSPNRSYAINLFDLPETIQNLLQCWTNLRAKIENFLRADSLRICKRWRASRNLLNFSRHKWLNAGNKPKRSSTAFLFSSHW